MEIEMATLEDAEAIESLLYEVHDVHASARGDLFIKGERKYTLDEVKEHILNDQTPVYVYRINGNVVAHAFIEYQIPTSPSLAKVKTMYIDDICVSQSYQHRGIGSRIMADLEELARMTHCHRMLLNVYNFNESAIALYTSSGLVPISTHMEKVLD